MMSRDPKGQTRDREPNTIRAQYLENICKVLGRIIFATPCIYWFYSDVLIVGLAGATPKFLGGPNLRPTTDVLQVL